MSVINKMLRDLDQRQAGQQVPSTNGHVAYQEALRQGTASIAGLSGNTELAARFPAWVGLVALLAATAAGGWLWLELGPDDLQRDRAAAAPPAMQPTSGAPVAMAAPASNPLPATAASAPAAVDQQTVPAAAEAAIGAADSPPVNVSPGGMVLRMEESLSARRALDALLSAPAPRAPDPVTANQAVAKAPVAVVPAPAPAPIAARPSTPVTIKSGALTAQADTPPGIQRQQQAGGDALAQAQGLWSAGSRDAAIDLLQQSIAVAERAAKATPGADTSAVLVPLVREMARMQLAEGRFGAVWEMLTRLEQPLASQPDLWAIRANAAQRLGRHQDSVHAYMVALQSRPDEQRWLLGTAVSLAAMGQISSASEMAEKARSVGPVSKDILNYLRQSGVVLRD